MSREWSISVDSLSRDLAADFQQGPIIDDRGRRFLGEETIATIQGLKIQVFANEHPPPHFRVYCAGETANFAIKDCRRLNGGLTKWERNIRKWHVDHKPELIEAWNRLRPADCPVGPYAEDGS